MQTVSFNSTVIRTALSCAAALSLCIAPGAWAQEKQKVSFKVTADNTRYPQRHTLNVGDEPGHLLTLYEIHRTFVDNAPVINGVKVKESMTRGYGDYVNNNGLSVNYTIYTLENGDKFFTYGRTMGQADASGKRTTITVGNILGGTGSFTRMRGMVRSTGASIGAKGFNETQTELEFWFEK